jgi:hypothetical protein
MQPFRPYRTTEHQTAARAPANQVDTPTFSDVFAEIGIVILVCLGLGLIAEIAAKMFGAG